MPAQIQSEAKLQSSPGFLPRTDTIQIDEKIAIARSEGFNPLAIELAIGSFETSASYKFLLFSLTVVAAALGCVSFSSRSIFQAQNPGSRDHDHR